jgi:hypothetical protein
VWMAVACTIIGAAHGGLNATDSDSHTKMLAMNRPEAKGGGVDTLSIRNARLDDHVTVEFIQMLRRAEALGRRDGDEELAESLRWWTDHLAEVLGVEVTEHDSIPCLSDLWLG